MFNHGSEFYVWIWEQYNNENIVFSFFVCVPCGSAPLPCWWECVKTFCSEYQQYSRHVVSSHCSALLIFIKNNLKTMGSHRVAGDKAYSFQGAWATSNILNNNMQNMSLNQSSLRNYYLTRPKALKSTYYPVMTHILCALQFCKMQRYSFTELSDTSLTTVATGS